MHYLLFPLRRWWWLLAAAGFLSAISSIVALQNIPPTYRATSTILVGQTLDNPNPDSGEFFLGQQLASIYTSLAMREPIQEATRNFLGLSVLPEYAVRVVANNPMIEVSVTDSSPERAMAVADELARQIILQSPSRSEQEEKARAEFITSQLESLQLRIEETETEIAELQLQMAEMISASDLERAQETQLVLQERLITYQTNYANILASSGTGAFNILRVLESASLPTKPIGLGSAVIVSIATILGIALAGGGAYLIDYFDNRLRTPEAIAAALNLPIVGYIPDSRQLKAMLKEDTLTSPFNLPPQATLSFELLATNLLFRFGESPPKSLLVTSLSSGTGKTTVASLLAVQLTRRGQMISLVDADLRNPDLHRLFGAEISPGLGDALQESLMLKSITQSTEDTRLNLISSGVRLGDNNVVFKPTDVLRILSQFDKKKINHVIIDSPPVIVTDTLLLASKVDAVLLVVRPDELNERAATILLDQLQQSQSNILGIVVNRIPGYMVASYGIKPYLGYSRRDGKKALDNTDVEEDDPTQENLPPFVEEE